MPKNWTKAEEETLKRFIATKCEPEIIARVMGRSEKAIYLKAYRMRIPLKPLCKRPIIRQLVEYKLRDVSILQVNRDFYQRTGLSQKRWPDLLYGYAEPTQDEIEAVADYFRWDTKDWAQFLTARQLKLEF